MAVLKYWDVAQGAYLSFYTGAQGPPGPQGSQGLSPTDSVQVVPGGGWIGAAPPVGTKLKTWCGSITVTAPSTAQNSIDITAAGFQYGYVAMVVVGDSTTAGGNNTGCSVDYNSTLTTLIVWAFYASAWVTSGTVRFDYLLVGA